MNRTTLPVWSLLFMVALAIAATTINLDAVLDAIRAVESNGEPFAIRDNTSDRSYMLSSEPAAIAKARELLELEHNIDMGAMQINSIHLSRSGISLANIFRPATQSSLSRTIFNEFHTLTKAVYGDVDLAVWRAVGAYNMGTRGVYQDYVVYTHKIMAKMGVNPTDALGGREVVGVGRGPGSELRAVTPPGTWRVGEPLDRAANQEDEFDAGPIGLLLILVLLVVGFVGLVKVGLLWALGKLLLRIAGVNAARQMLKRRRRPL